MQTRHELESLLVGILQLIDKNLRRLDVYSKFWPAAEGSAGQLEDKIAAETALVVMLISRIDKPSSELGRLAEGMKPILARFIRSERNRRSIMQNPQAAATLGLGHIYLSCAGCQDAQWDRLVGCLLSHGFGDIKERYPHRMLDRLWARKLMGLSVDMDMAEVERGWFRRRFAGFEVLKRY